jgi:MFS family permease
VSNTKTTDQVDVRGPRFVAWITTAILVIALIVSGVSTLAAAVILSLQAVVFAIGTVGGPRSHPYGLVFASVVAPRLGPVSEREPVPPLKFAQLVGFVFAASGAAGFAAGSPLVGAITTAAALAAAFLNAAFGICLGCQLYPLVVRLRPTPRTSEPA